MLARVLDGAGEPQDVARVAPFIGTTSTSSMRPSVTVPVLSRTTVVTRLVCSSTSGPLMTIPSCAPRPVPTISAVGVASPSAQGQAMMRTATAAVKAAETSAVEEEPARERRQREPDHDRDEDGRDAVGEPLDGRLARLRLGHQPGDLGEGRVGADAGGADDQPAGRVHGRAGDLVSRPDVHRNGLAGQHRLVDGGAPLDDDAVGRELLAGPDDEQVADR